MGDRLNWMTCILDGEYRLSGTGISWCGRTLTPGPTRYVFPSIDAAANNGRRNGRWIACRQCVSAINAVLRSAEDD